MIKGFENETQPLNNYELTVLLPKVVAGLSNKIGKKNAVNSGHMIKRLTERGYKITDIQVRKIVYHIRNNQIIRGICSSNRGYWIADTFQELDDCIESLTQRKDRIASTINSLKDDKEYFSGLPRNIRMYV